MRRFAVVATALLAGAGTAFAGPCADAEDTYGLVTYDIVCSALFKCEETGGLTRLENQFHEQLDKVIDISKNINNRGQAAALAWWIPALSYSIAGIIDLEENAFQVNTAAVKETKSDDGFRCSIPVKFSVEKLRNVIRASKMSENYNHPDIQRAIEEDDLVSVIRFVDLLVQSADSFVEYKFVNEVAVEYTVKNVKGELKVSDLKIANW